MKIKCESQAARISLQDYEGHRLRVNKLYTFNTGLDLSYNMEAAAHKIGVNLIRKERNYWFSEEK